jgi:hypothetical protein
LVFSSSEISKVIEERISNYYSNIKISMENEKSFVMCIGNGTNEVVFLNKEGNDWEIVSNGEINNLKLFSNNEEMKEFPGSGIKALILHFKKNNVTLLIACNNKWVDQAISQPMGRNFLSIIDESIELLISNHPVQEVDNSLLKLAMVGTGVAVGSKKIKRAGSLPPCPFEKAVLITVYFKKV